ncbi:ParA family protein [Sphingobium scionense]
MQTIVINNRKGGVGKTMLATHLAWFLAEDGARVLFIDLDAQGNGSRTLAARVGEGDRRTCSTQTPSSNCRALLV